MNKINHKEYEILKVLGDNWKWIARDSRGDNGGNLFVYLKKPFKRDVGVWHYGRGAHGIDSHLFQFIQWEDEEPCNIDDLVREYESRKLVQPPVKEKPEKEEKFMKPTRMWTQEDFDWLTQELDILIG